MSHWCHVIINEFVGTFMTNTLTHSEGVISNSESSQHNQYKIRGVSAELTIPPSRTDQNWSEGCAEWPHSACVLSSEVRIQVDTSHLRLRQQYHKAITPSNSFPNSQGLILLETLFCVLTWQTSALSSVQSVDNLALLNTTWTSLR